MNIPSDLKYTRSDEWVRFEGDTITIDAHKLLLQLEVEDGELARRRAAWKQPEPRYKRGVLAKFSALARPANEGAVTG